MYLKKTNLGKHLGLDQSEDTYREYIKLMEITSVNDFFFVKADKDYDDISTIYLYEVNPKYIFCNVKMSYIFIVECCTYGFSFYSQEDLKCNPFTEEGKVKIIPIVEVVNEMQEFVFLKDKFKNVNDLTTTDLKFLYND